MFPIALDLTRVSVLLVGSGKLLAKRLAQLEEAGATKVTVIEDRLPTQAELQACSIVMGCGLSAEDSKQVAQNAHAAGKLINFEDDIPLCDFYFTANVRRGDLLIAVSTGGASPTLARRVRDYIGNRFGAEWAGYTREMAAERRALKAAGKGMKEVLASSDEMLKNKGWLSCTRCPKEAV